MNEDIESRAEDYEVRAMGTQKNPDGTLVMTVEWLNACALVRKAWLDGYRAGQVDATKRTSGEML